jgi:hypothetical protein
MKYFYFGEELQTDRIPYSREKGGESSYAMYWQTRCDRQEARFHLAERCRGRGIGMPDIGAHIGG